MEQTKPDSYYESLDKRSREYKQWLKNGSRAPQGAGDVIEDVLNSPAIKPITKVVKGLLWKKGEDCGCDQRREAINKLLPIRYKARCLTEQEFKWYDEFSKRRTMRIVRDDVKKIAKLFADVFSRRLYIPCNTCSAKSTLDMIKKLDIVYEQYKSAQLDDLS